MPTQSRATSVHKKNDFTVSIGLAVVIVFFVGSGILSYYNIKTLRQNMATVTHTHEVITAVGDLMALTKDAETGQRGFLLTGKPEYLDPYNVALDNLRKRISDVARLTADNEDQQNHITVLRGHIERKLEELATTIELRKTKGFDAVLGIVLTDRGKHDMDGIRAQVAEMQELERSLRIQRINEMNNAYDVALLSGITTGILGVILAIIVGSLIRRSNAARQRQEWLQTGQVGLANAMFGEQRIEHLGENILKFLAEYCDAHAGAFFVRDGHDFKRLAEYGLPDDASTPHRFMLGEGLLGQAAKDKRTLFVRDVPDDYMNVGTALVKGKPRNLLIAPSISDDETNAVIELGFVHPLDDYAVELMKEASEAVGIAIKSANYRRELQNLLEETQRQAEELQTQSEELRVNNEELEEQSRALKESQINLEQQQVELEQTNSQLEEQAQILEAQKDDIARTNTIIEAKARELEQASKYKSDFLANMSHELRTPLNSSLILAKLLADNPTGNLTEEQVKFAQTIQSSGNDLLTLINDILDLSKIEAGHMEIRAEKVQVDRLIHDLGSVFKPLAKAKNLNFGIKVEHGCATSLETDRQRLEQVLKNLIANAIKFTDKGSVELIIGTTAEKEFSFRVTDTGIGISDEHQQSIFDAFRQADGTISRKYGGTGLGLSISRELVRLLGGRIELTSEYGKGSTFTVFIPALYDGNQIQPRTLSAAPQAPAVQEIPEPTRPLVNSLDDDRDNLQNGKRAILVVEDDAPFARILYDLIHELDFQCLIATSAEDALVMTRQYMPSAIVLDVGLPDHSGLSVLDRLKRDARTRHIPVHVVSANDYAQTALSLGAVGYMLKPVKREELVDALKQIELRLDQTMRRVLIVEDDAVQRESMKKLLGIGDVETVAVGTAAQCLEKLKENTYDCMVLDLTLPDATGYSLLETLSQEESYAFPPVIVYTGRDLSADEEQRLRRYSHSIIIKGAKSPERLLDEVTLFLHQVVSELPADKQKMIEAARNRDAALEKRRILVVEDDVRNVYAVTSIFEPLGAEIVIARNGREALNVLEKSDPKNDPIDLVLMDVMMPEMDGLTATRLIRKKPEWKKLPIIMLTAKAMKDDQERCLEAGANDYMAKPLDVEKLLSLVRVWMPR